MPSASVLKEKQAQVSQIVDSLKNAQAGVLVDYRGLSVDEDTALRVELRNAGVEYSVIKNTLLKLACEQAGIEGLDDILHGPTALAVSSDDAVAPAKVLAGYAKKNEKLEIKGGFMDGAAMSLAEISKLAATPSYDELIAKIMGSLNAPVSNLVRLLDTIAQGGEEIADLIAKKQGEAAAEAPAEAAEAPAEAAEAAETAEAAE